MALLSSVLTEKEVDIISLGGEIIFELVKLSAEALRAGRLSGWDKNRSFIDIWGGQKTIMNDENTKKKPLDQNKKE